MTSAEPGWLHTLGQIAGTVLMLELCFLLLLVCAIVIALAYASWWLHRNVIPVLDLYGGKAQQYMGIAIQGSDRVVGGVAEFRGRWEAITTGARVMLFGTRGAKRPLPAPDAAADGSALEHVIPRVNIPPAAVPALPELPGRPASSAASALPGTDTAHQTGLNGHADELR